MVDVLTVLSDRPNESRKIASHDLISFAFVLLFSSYFIDLCIVRPAQFIVAVAVNCFFGNGT